ncbi:diaminopimelate epimerase [Flavihumibacter rivuli]|uniref:diaminopimelate epimerase n=1 Tax=Flavihumibacter rivuli TaxID=2838156 RepID=UPI001BDF6F6E|nr:diaminopimelate epimerase [Flavihumibacter rivuli]ULQ57391.1 diaminopimelate epimerase [Flavihumibacter rivuli]
MDLHFYKYQGTGNDFVILDNRKGEYEGLSTRQIHFLCDRRFGIGADGLMLLNKKEGYDFEMKYYNSDGHEGSMCGNGGRCLVKFAFHSGIVRTNYVFSAIDGDHHAEIDEHGIVRLKMKDVDQVLEHHGDAVLNTGSPHYVKAVRNLAEFDVFHKGREIRNSEAFREEGINVNFVEVQSKDEIMVRTYERGVEDETLSCGTGVTACALVNYHNEYGFNDVTVHTRGGRLSVEFDRNEDGTYTNVYLCGPAEKVFEGDITLP